MLPQKNRLPYQEFSVRGYQSVKTPYFSLKFKKNNLPHARIGVVIGVGVEKNAAKRNFWKRQGKSLLKKQLPRGIDFLLIFSKKTKELKKDFFNKELSKALSRIF